MKGSFIAALGLTLVFGSAAVAQQVRCEHSTGTYGAKTTADMSKADIVKSWLGDKVVLDLKKNTLQIGLEDGWWEALPLSKIQKAKKFTTYIAYFSEPSANGTAVQHKYAVRVYEDMRSEFTMSQNRYKTLKAKGMCK